MCICSLWDAQKQMVSIYLNICVCIYILDLYSSHPTPVTNVWLSTPLAARECRIAREYYILVYSNMREMHQDDIHSIMWTRRFSKTIIRLNDKTGILPFNALNPTMWFWISDWEWSYKTYRYRAISESCLNAKFGTHKYNTWKYKDTAN